MSDIKDDVLKDVLRWAESRCPCDNDQPNPCPLCGASVENLEACKSAENTLPRDLLVKLRAATEAARAVAEEQKMMKPTETPATYARGWTTLAQSEAGEPVAKALPDMNDMAMLIRMLVRHAPAHLQIRDKAMDYLRRFGLEGSPLRSEPALQPAETPAITEEQKMRDFFGGSFMGHPPETSATQSGASGWIVTNGKGDRYRCWGFGPEWTDDREKATRYARREDAEAVHAEDEDAWRIIPYEPAPTQSGAGEPVVKARYRLLAKGDAIQRGDEALGDDTVTWEPLVGWEIGMEYRPDVFVPVRRILSTLTSGDEPAQEGPR